MTDPALWRRAGTAIALASALPFATVAGLLAGLALDRVLGLGRGLAVLGALLGFAAGVYQLFRGMSRLPDDQPPDPPP